VPHTAQTCSVAIMLLAVGHRTCFGPVPTGNAVGRVPARPAGIPQAALSMTMRSSATTCPCKSTCPKHPSAAACPRLKVPRHSDCCGAGHIADLEMQREALARLFQAVGNQRNAFRLDRTSQLGLQCRALSFDATGGACRR